jgi:hypothetical protein
MLVDKERTIHTLLRRHPDLIDKALKGCQPAYELVREKQRLDLVFQIRNCVLIVEVKRTVLTAADVDQLAGYCDTMSAGAKLAKHHFLVGKRPNDAKKLEAHINAQNHRIIPKYLWFDIPTELIWDTLETRYVPFHEDCSRDPRYKNYIKVRV